MIPPPEGMSETDYETIEAAVTETVRGRWFLAEYARRSRVDEMRQMLDGLARLEQVVREQQAQPADPSVRLLIQRLKEVTQALDRMAGEMRAEGLADKFSAAVEAQARAVAGLLRLNSPSTNPQRAPEPRRAALPEPEPEKSPDQSSSGDARHSLLERLDKLPISEKLALFA